jgi:hypothetical protein
MFHQPLEERQPASLLASMGSIYSSLQHQLSHSANSTEPLDRVKLSDSCSNHNLQHQNMSHNPATPNSDECSDGDGSNASLGINISLRQQP